MKFGCLWNQFEFSLSLLIEFEFWLYLWIEFEFIENRGQILVVVVKRSKFGWSYESSLNFLYIGIEFESLLFEIWLWFVDWVRIWFCLWIISNFSCFCKSDQILGVFVNQFEVCILWIRSNFSCVRESVRIPAMILHSFEFRWYLLTEFEFCLCFWISSNFVIYGNCVRIFTVVVNHYEFWMSL